MLKGLVAALVASLVLVGAGQAQGGSLVLRGATLIDGTDAPPLPDATVVVKNGWIVAVGKRGEVPIPHGVKVVDLAGRYLLPGFVEMHGHLAIAMWKLDTVAGKPVLQYPYDETASRELAQWQLAFGITTVRNPAAPTKEAISLRDRVRSGQLLGPRIFTSGAPLDRPSIISAIDPVTTEAEVRAAVAKQAAAGVDFIKVYSSLDSNQIRVAVDEAHRWGLPVVGHLWRTSWTDAAESGIDGITHIIVNNAKLLPESRREEFRKSIRGGQFMYEWFKYADFDGPEIKHMIAAIVAHRVTIDPTIIAFEWTAWTDDSMHFAEARRFIPPTLAVKPPPPLGWTKEDFVTERAQIARMQELARRLFEAGVILTVGTDGTSPWLYHRELELLAGAGIPNADVIRMATRNAAISLRRTSEFGTVEAGRRADLVVLERDPLADIKNTRSIEWVVQGGAIARPDSFLPARLRRGH